MQGTLESGLLFGRSTIQAMNRMKIAAAAIGNHELDWGVDTLRARMAESKYPWLAANLVDSATGKRPDWVKPWAMIQVDSLRVAVIGYMAGGTKSMVRPENTAGLRWRTGLPAIADILDEVKAKRPSVVILLAHEGGFCEQTGCSGEIFDLAKQLPAGSVDLIVAGHTHVKLATEVNGIPIVESRSSGTAIGVTDLVRRADGGFRGYIDVRPAYVDQVTPDSALGELTYQVRKQIGAARLPADRDPRPAARQGTRRRRVPARHLHRRCAAEPPPRRHLAHEQQRHPREPPVRRRHL